MNSADGVLNGIRDTAARNSVIVPFSSIPTSRIGELAARFDVVLGYTPVENTAPSRPTLVSMSGVVNAATSYSGMAAGSWVTLFGDGLASTTRNWDASDIVDGKLPESLDGVSVRIDGKPAAVAYVSPKQINAQAPSDTASGSVQVTVTNAAGTSDPVAADAEQFKPAFFQLAQEFVVAIRADGVSIGPTGLVDGVATAPARPGDRITVFGSGFGPTPLASPVVIRIDTQTAAVSFAGLSSPGVYQFQITVPDLPDGDHSVWAQIAGVRTQKIGRIRIERATG